MRKILALLLLLAAGPAIAQTPSMAPGQVLGNDTAAARPGRAADLSAVLDRAFGAPSVHGCMLNRGASVYTCTRTPVLGLPGTALGSLGFAGSTSGTATVRPQAAAGTPTLSLPTTTGTLASGATAPVVLDAVTGILTCPSCVTSSGGGAITGTSPVVVSAAGAVSVQGATGTVLSGSGGTGSVFSATPAVTSLALGGAVIGSNALAVTGSVAITSPSASALVAGLNGATNPAFAVDASTASSATGVRVKSAAAGGGVLISALSSATNESLSVEGKGNGTLSLGAVGASVVVGNGGTGVSIGSAITYGGVTLNNTVTGTGSMVLSTGASLVTPQLGVATGTSLALNGAAIGSNALAVTGTAAISSTLTSAAHAITSSSANALVVGLNGATNPAFNVNASGASSATGINISSAAAGSGVAISVTSSATNEASSLNSKGSGTLSINNVGTGRVDIGGAGGGVTIGSALTYGGVALSNAVTGTGNMVLSAGPTFTGSVTMAAMNATTSVTSPIYYGGTATSSTLTLASTSGVGATDSMIFKTGNQQTRMTILTGGNVGIRDTNPQTPLVVNSNSTMGIAGFSGAVMQLNGADATPTVLLFQSWGDGQNPNLLMRGARGTASAPTASQSGDVLGFFSAQGYAASAYDTAGLSGVYIGAGENHTLTANGTFIAFLTVANTTTTRSEAMRVHGSGGLSVGSTTDPTVGKISALNGYISGASAGVSCPAGISATTGRAVNGIITAC